MARNYKQGIYQVKNWEKYIGTNNPTYRSEWEQYVFEWADRNKNILKWGAEVVVVPYYNEVKGRKARYIVDVYLEYLDKEGNLQKDLVEIKPYNQTLPPKRGKKRKDVYDHEVLTWIQNNCKWKEAQKYASERGWNFRIITENSIFKG